MANSFEIEKGVALPPKGGNSGTLYPLRKMEVGDSFFIPTETALKTQNSLSSCARNVGDKKFATRKVEGGIRVWRTA